MGRSSRHRQHPSELWLLRFAVSVYAVAATGLWVAIEFLVDRVWPVTLFAFGPRWVAAVPLLPLAAWATFAAVRDREWRAVGTVALTGCVVLFGIMDLRLGLNRAAGTAQIRVMTQNLGASRVTAEMLDRLMRTERIDVAALQECPFYDFGPARFGWQFYYGGNLCLVSRFPFTVLDEPDPQNAWKFAPHAAMRFEVQAPTGRFQLLNVHFETIRGGLDALRTAGWPDVKGFAANRRSAARQSQDSRERIAAVQGPVIVAGDFNLPVESVIYRAYWEDLANAFSRCGRGLGHTKFTRAFGIRIDHVLMSEAWDCTDARVLASPYRGDHRPVVVDLRIR